MTATLAIHPPKTEPAAPVVEDVAEEPSVVDTIKVVLPVTMLIVFLVVIGAFVLGGTPVGEAVGYGAYLSFWIGGGFGAIFSGAVWGQKAMGH